MQDNIKECKMCGSASKSWFWCLNKNCLFFRKSSNDIDKTYAWDEAYGLRDKVSDMLIDYLKFDKSVDAQLVVELVHFIGNATEDYNMNHA